MMYIKKPFAWANIGTIALNLTLWTLAFLRDVPGFLAFVALIGSIAAVILVSAKANGKTLLPRSPFHSAPTEKTGRIQV
jgi:hypothetical protein